MKRRLTRAYDNMTMPDGCTHRIEQQLQLELQKKKTGQYTKAVAPMPRHRGSWAGAVAAVCLVLALSVGGTMLFLRMAEPENVVPLTTEKNPVTEITVYERTAEDLYMAVTDIPADEVEEFAKRVRQNVLDEDWDALAEKIAYPITIWEQTIPDAEGFLELAAGYEPNMWIREAFEAESCTGMFCNWQGICMADGYIWINEVDSELRITAINDLFRETTGQEFIREKVPMDFINILRGSAIYFPEYDNVMFIDEYCKLLSKEAGMYVTVSGFSVVDMDRDGICEAVLRLSANGDTDYGLVILRYEDSVAWGYPFPGEQVTELKKDGTFLSGGVESGLKFTNGEAEILTALSEEEGDKRYAQWHVYPCQRVDVVLASYEYASEERGLMPGSQFALFEELVRGNLENNWDSLKEILTHEGLICMEGEGTVSVYDPDTPGTWMYGMLTNVNGFGQFSELGYYICTEDREYQAEIRDMLSDSPEYAVDVMLPSEESPVQFAEFLLDYFGWDDLLNSGRDAAQAEALMDEFAAAFFAGDTELMRIALVDDFTAWRGSYPGIGEPIIISHKGLPTKAMEVGETLSVSLELLEPGQDSCSYLTMELVKQESGWKVLSYALEK